MTRDEAIGRIRSMRDRWRMYAMTREAFVAALSVYLDVFVPGVRPYDVLLKGLIKGASAEPLLEDLDEEFAHATCDRALATFEQ